MSVYILGGSRTAFGSFLGQFSSVTAPQLGGRAIAGALNNAGVNKDMVNEVFMGQVIQAGVGQAPARQATLLAGLSEAVPATTINKVCGSGMQALIQGARSVLSGENQVVVAGGMENMSLAPHLIPQSRSGIKFGAAQLRDSMQWDGLWDVYSDRAMGNCAEECVSKYGFSRPEQDAFAMESFRRAQAAMREGAFRSEIVAVAVPGKGGEVQITEDEGPGKANFEKMPTLKPAFEKNGTITAANASTINDGAAALVLGGAAYASRAKFRVLGWSSFAQHPTWFSTAPVGAIQKVLERVNLKKQEIDLWEINEAFAAVSMAAMRELELSHDKVNVLGGAIALGHPIGASGARIVLTLMNALERRQARYGCAAICIGGGEALALVIEKMRP